MDFIDRMCLCSGRIYWKITLKLCLQVGQVLSLIKLNRTIFYIRGCLIYDLPHISTKHLGSLGTQESDSLRENKFRQIEITPQLWQPCSRSLPMDDQGYQGKPIEWSG